MIGVVTALALLIMTAPLAPGTAPATPATASAASGASDQDVIAAARELYASAAYEDALAALNSLPDSSRPLEETRAIEQYRALCLLALGRTSEAERSIEAVVASDPLYRPASEVSPRLRAAFSEVRKRVLPSLIQQQYTLAKSEYDRKDFANAAADFTKVLDAMNDPDIAAAATSLTDLRTLTMGFKDLAVAATMASAAATPPPAPVPPPVEPAPVARPIKIYTADDRGVVPPVVLRQDLPPYPGNVQLPRSGLIEVQIDETGVVENAIMRVSTGPTYDSLALAAARTWRYRPALANGSPVKYRKAVQVTVKPGR